MSLKLPSILKRNYEYKNIFNSKNNIILRRYDILAKPIAPTPTLFGAETKEFLKEMKRPDTPNDKKIKERIDNSRHVDFF